MFFKQRAAENATLSCFFGCASLAKAAVVGAVTADIPPQPQDMTRIVEANLRGTAPEPARA